MFAGSPEASKITERGVATSCAKNILENSDSEMAQSRLLPVAFALVLFLSACTVPSNGQGQLHTPPNNKQHIRQTRPNVLTAVRLKEMRDSPGKIKDRAEPLAVEVKGAPKENEGDENRVRSAFLPSRKMKGSRSRQANAAESKVLMAGARHFSGATQNLLKEINEAASLFEEGFRSSGQ